MLDIQRPDIALTDDRQLLPFGSDLPDSDDIPVDNENQNWIPNVLLMLLQNIWGTRCSRWILKFGGRTVQE
jgi:hypothetical protein